MELNNYSETIKSFLKNFNNYYLVDENAINVKKYSDFNISDIVFYQIKRITFEEKAPRKEALENVISSMRISGANLIYLILSDGSEVKFYFGVSRDLYQIEEKRELSINTVGDQILRQSIVGNFRGSIVEKVDPVQSRMLRKQMFRMTECSVIEGVPGIDENKEAFQAVDRLVDVMCGDEFGVMIVANAYTPEEIFTIQRKLEKLYTALSGSVKHSIQVGKNKGESYSKSVTKGSNKSSGTSISTSIQEGKSTSDTIGTNEGTNSSSTSSSGKDRSSTDGESKGTSKSRQTGTSSSKSKQESKNLSDGSSESATEQKGTNNSTSQSETCEEYNKLVKDWIEYFDKVLFPRLDYGKGRGLFSCCSFMFTVGKGQLRKLSNAFISLYSGSEGNRVPLKYTDVNNSNPICKALLDFQIPVISGIDISSKAEEFTRSALSQNVENHECRLGNWYSANELSLIVGLPQKEVHGVSLKEEVDFGLNFDSGDETDSFKIGNLVESGIELKNIPVTFNKNILNKHIFVTGVTGSGKTTTCQNLLIQSGLPFMVIEPAKTEYRIMQRNNYDDFVIFTLGNEQVAPFRLNPFEFFRHEIISSHVDMVKASIEASFDMESAIPQIIEATIYKAYEKAGWDIETNRNIKYDAQNKDPFAEDSTAFPTLSEVIALIDEVVSEQGFDDRLKKDYIGSIKARLQSLTIGSKGQMLDTRRSVNFHELLKMRVVLEIEDIKSGDEKAFVMGLVMSHMNEALKAEHMENPSFMHITLIEEAHRLLTKFTPGDSPNRRHGTEIFADMLAEVRKYGESLIIADQIPDKMIPEVLKNTNTKIVHRLFAQDDKNAIGNTMALNDKQKEFLSFLEVGRAVVFSQNYENAVQVQIAQLSDTTSPNEVTSGEIHKMSNEYLYKRKNTGIIAGMQFLNVSLERFEEFYAIHRQIMKSFVHFLELNKGGKKIEAVHINAIQKFVGRYGIESSANYFSFRLVGAFYDTKAKNGKSFIENTAFLLHEIMSLPSDSDIIRKNSKKTDDGEEDIFNSFTRKCDKVFDAMSGYISKK
ncbi:MAG: DUF87 domain-containing protein [Ruminococcus flavefaciens]|nr:DUF87 domain-containing protein [Ruminococcus flavefaciens]